MMMNSHRSRRVGYCWVFGLAVLAGSGLMRTVLAAGPLRAIEIKPPGLSLDRPPTADLKRSFVVRAVSPEPLTVLAVQSLDPAIGVSFRSNPANRTWIVTATLPAGYHVPGGGQAEIRLQTNRPDHPDIGIPIRVWTGPVPVEEFWLRDAETLIGKPAPLATGATIGQVVQKLQIAEQTYHRWRNQYGGMKASEAKRLKELEIENARLKKLVADLSLDNAMLKEVAKGEW